MIVFLQKTWIRHAMLAIGIIIFWQIGAAALRFMATKTGNKIIAPIANNSTIQLSGMKKLSTLDASNMERMLNLFDRAENHKEKHKVAFLKFYPYHFASSTLLLILSSLAVVLLFLTAQVGLNNVNPFVRTVFFTLAALTSFYALAPLVYKQENNIATNLSKYILYDNLQGEIYNYTVTSPNMTTSNDTLSFTEFHNLVSKRMSEINSINVEFDYKVIPVPDYGLKKEQ